MRAMRRRRPVRRYLWTRVYRYCLGRQHEIGRGRECPKCNGREFIRVR